MHMLPAKMKGGRGDFRCVASVSVVSALAFGFSYLPGMATISGMTGTAGLGRSVAYEPARDLITTVSNHVNHVNPVLISAYDYANDAAGRRVSRNADSFGYNARSEVIGAVHRHKQLRLCVRCHRQPCLVGGEYSDKQLYRQLPQSIHRCHASHCRGV